MSTAAPQFTVLMSTHRSPELFPCSLASVLAQSDPDFEVLLFHGPTAAPVDLGTDPDPRIRLVVGDRATALRQARGTFVAEAGDEVLWFPDHLVELSALLEEVDFGNLLHAELDPDGSLALTPGDLADAGTRQRMLSTRWSCFAATCAGYRLAAYRRLPPETDPPARDVPADLALWRRFLTAPDVSVGTRFAVESLTLVAAYRTDRARRATEGAAVLARIRDDRGRRDLRSRALGSWQAELAATQASLDHTAAELHAVYRSRGEIAAKVAEYATSRGEYAESRRAYAELNTQLRADLTQMATRVADQSAEVAQLRGQVARLRTRTARLQARNNRLRLRASAGRASVPPPRRLIGRLIPPPIRRLIRRVRRSR